MSVTAVTCLAVILSLSGCGDDDKQKNSSGKLLYNKHCAGCHKESGGGNFLAGVPANRSTNLSGGEVINLILYGSDRFPNMPNFPQLDPNQARAIAIYIRDR
ncbi:c-type cytochrome [Marinobacterium jannaschii]|uniref:c-type cytochrome n=1 Tax=Marinobacterium jannaschii TaxID=64970 RepID=UPI000483B5D4|nr:cytochrome c [Marinobacterium jannaschii]